MHNGVEVETSQNHSFTNKYFESLDEGRFVFECIWQGTSKPLPHVVELFHALDCSYSAFVWLKLFPFLFPVTK